MNLIRKADLVSARLPDNDEKFPSQYGMVTNRQWVLMETGRISGTKLAEMGKEIALVWAERSD